MKIEFNKITERFLGCSLHALHSGDRDGDREWEEALETVAAPLAERQVALIQWMERHR